ncbi:MAG: YfcE family phosphodiesterase [Deltaproteobacteria bacterium]|nr:YfcE family phosphodiesterase [Deltaproteobacteria bacterium]
MKIAVMSDTHGNVQLAVKALKQNGKIDRLIHLGDHYRDGVAIGDKTRLHVDAISGNTDISSEPWTEREKILELDGVRIFVTHGDIYKVKQGIDRLVGKAIEEDVQAVLFGHTHLPMKQRIGNILFLNPGCILSNNSSNSYALLCLTNGHLEGEIVKI